MTPVSVVCLADPEGAAPAALPAALPGLLAGCRPGDEVLVAWGAPPTARALDQLRARLAGLPFRLRYALPGAAPEGAPGDAVTLHVLPFGPRLARRDRLEAALRRATGDAVAVVSPATVAAPEVLADLRRALAADAAADLAVAAPGPGLAGLATPQALHLVRRALLDRVLPVPAGWGEDWPVALAWRIVLRARRVAVTPVAPVPPPVAADPWHLAGLFQKLRTLAEGEAAPDHRRQAVREALTAQELGAFLAFLRQGEPDLFWALADACPPDIVAAAAQQASETPDAVALASLTSRPRWALVQEWQAARRAGRVPGAPLSDLQADALRRWKSLCRGEAPPG